MVIVDSSVWIEYLRGNHFPETVWLDRQIGSRPFALTDLILCEVLQGIPEPQFLRTKAALLNFQVYSNCTADLALAAASNYRYLRKRGFTVRATVDSLIAS